MIMIFRMVLGDLFSVYSFTMSQKCWKGASYILAVNIIRSLFDQVQTLFCCYVHGQLHTQMLFMTLHVSLYVTCKGDNNIMHL